MPLASDEERRAPPDRRAEATSVWDALWGVGRRMGMRRVADHACDYYVERDHVWSLALVVMILMLSIVDAVITISLLDHDCHEINPLMAWLLERGVVPFLIGKYVLTAAGLPVLLLFKNFRMFGTRFRVGYLVPIVVALYVLLLAYQWSLLRTHALGKAAPAAARAV